jgi:hypothetical protein
MRPEVEAAIIAGCFGILTVIGTLAAQFYSTRKPATTQETSSRRNATSWP